MKRLLRWLTWAFRRHPDWRRLGRFSGPVVLEWKGPRDYYFRGGTGFMFERGFHADKFAPTGESIVPGDMDTDGGSIPRFAWVLPQLDPMSFLPAYLVHDWEFDQHHKLLSGKSFEEVNRTLVEGVYTLMMTGVAKYDLFDLHAIWDGVSSPFGQDVWDGVRSVE